MIRTTLPAGRLGAPAAVRAYKQLKMAERAFRTMKDTIEIRPIHHHLENRVRAHIFLCMLAYYVAFELHATPPPTAVHRRHPTRPSRPGRARDPLPLSPREGRQRHAPPTGIPAHTLPDLLADLATLCRNTIRIGQAEHTLTRLTTPTPLQTRALELLDITLHP